MKKKISLVVSCLFLTTLCLPLLGWSTVLEVSMQENHESWMDWAPNSVVDSNGNSYVTWTSLGWDEGNMTSDIYMAKISSTGGLGSVLNVSIHPDAVAWDEMNPEIAAGPLHSYVTYCGWDGTCFQIYWVNVFLSLYPGMAKKISTHADNAGHNNYHPEIASSALGQFHVVWYGSDGNDDEIYWVKLNALGTPGTVQKISTHTDNATHHDSNPRVAGDNTGNSYVVWHGSDGNDYEIYWVKVDSAGTPGTVQKISTHADNTTHSDGSPRIRVDASGNSYVVWYGYDGNDYEIYWVKVDSTGTPGTVQKISIHADNVANGDFDPEIAVDSSGNSYVVWKGFDGNDYEIYWVKVDSAGTPGTVQKVSTHSDNVTNRDYHPQIGVDSSGTSYVTWAGDDGDNSDLDIYYVTIDSSGNPGTVQKVSAVPDDLDFDETEYLDIVVDSSGYSYVYWAGLSGTTDWQIYFMNNRV